MRLDRGRQGAFEPHGGASFGQSGEVKDEALPRRYAAAEGGP